MNDPTQRNLDYYARLTKGRSDYWRYMPAPRMRVDTILRDLVRHSPASVIDIGCGDGSLLAQIHRVLPQARLAGVDLSPTQVAQNSELMPEIAWYAADAESAPLTGAGVFDAVVASEIVEHLGDPARFLRNIRSLAAPHAVLLLTTQSGRVGTTERFVGHVRHFSAGDMSALLATSGWNPEKVWNAGFPFHDLSKRIANLRPRQTMSAFGEREYGAPQRFVSGVLRLLFHLNSTSRGAQLYAVARRSSDG